VTTRDTGQCSAETESQVRRKSSVNAPSSAAIRRSENGNDG